MNPWQALLAPPPRAQPSVASPPGPNPPPHTYRPPSLLNPAAMPVAIRGVGAVMTCPLAAGSTNTLSGMVTWTPLVRTGAAPAAAASRAAGFPPPVGPNHSWNIRKKLRFPYAEHRSPSPGYAARLAAFGWYGVYVYSVAVARFATVTGALPHPV